MTVLLSSLRWKFNRFLRTGAPADDLVRPADVPLEFRHEHGNEVDDATATSQIAGEHQHAGCSARDRPVEVGTGRRYGVRRGSHE